MEVWLQHLGRAQRRASYQTSHVMYFKVQDRGGRGGGAGGGVGGWAREAGGGWGGRVRVV